MSRSRALSTVARAPFLLLPVTPVAVGAAAAALEGRFDLWRTLVALSGLLGLHVAVDALNEASDYRRGIELVTRRTPLSGSSGTLPAGDLSPRAATVLAGVGAAIGVAAGVWLLRLVERPLLPILILGAIAVFGYTDFLVRNYLGELFAGLGLGALPVLGTALVQVGDLGRVAVVASVPPFLMTFNLLLLNGFPGEEADRRGGRRNLLILLGRRGAARVYVACALLEPAWISAAVAWGTFPSQSLLALPPSFLLALPLRWTWTRPDSGGPRPHPGST